MGHGAHPFNMIEDAIRRRLIRAAYTVLVLALGYAWGKGWI